MPDVDLRELERRHQSGDPDAWEPLLRAHERTGDIQALFALWEDYLKRALPVLPQLVRALERAGDQAALCELGFHTLRAAHKPSLTCTDEGCTARSDDEDALPCNPITWATWCTSCQNVTPVHWVDYQPWRVGFFNSGLGIRFLPDPSAGRTAFRIVSLDRVGVTIQAQFEE